MKTPWRRGPSRLEQPEVAAAADPDAGYEEVRTPHGRRKHLRAHPMLGVLCGWPGRMVPADPSMEDCLMCKAALRAMTEAAS